MYHMYLDSACTANGALQPKLTVDTLVGGSRNSGHKRDLQTHSRRLQEVRSSP